MCALFWRQTVLDTERLTDLIFTNYTMQEQGEQNKNGTKQEWGMVFKLRPDPSPYHVLRWR